MARMLNKFPRNDIISLTESAPHYDLAESVGPDLRLRDLLDGGDFGSLADLPLGYGPAGGRADLRKAIAAAHGVEADDVVVMVGGMQAIFLTGFAQCTAGDEIVTTVPSFPNTLAALRASGAELKTLRLDFEQAYRLTAEAIRPLLGLGTRLVCLTSPQNPSGVTTPRETVWKVLQMMEEICPAAILLIDETYREAVYGGQAIVPSAATLSAKIVATASLSKCHGAPGLRLGWAITRNPALREQLTLGKFNTAICCSTLDEALGLRVFERREEIIGARRIHLDGGLKRVAAWAEANSAYVEWVRPDAGALCCIRLRPDLFDEPAVARFYQAIAREGVRVGPGSWFGEKDRVFRLGFGLLPMPELEQGLAKMADALRGVYEQAA
jgi:aspartate/methionine/tyrosine aminotransferase